MNRVLFREHCFKMLFAADFSPQDEKSEQVSLYFEQPQEDESDENGHVEIVHEVVFDEFDKEEASKKVLDCLSNLNEIDEKISEAVEGWSFERMAKAEKTILRLAYYEMKYDENIPESVAINEAVNLAKKFGRDESSAFVNAVLSKLV